jgi:hypothetical protein
VGGERVSSEPSKEAKPSSPLLHPLLRIDHLRVVGAPAKPPPRERSGVENEAVLVDELVRVKLVGENELREKGSANERREPRRKERTVVGMGYRRRE